MKRYKTELTASQLAEIKDEEIDFSDIPATDEAFWAEAQVVLPQPKKAISLRLDADLLAFFQLEGPGYQTRINAVLRAYVDAMRAKTKRASAPPS
jgi:uncharacterized protein (DUF4415 family)